MEASAFSPSHITGFFEIVNDSSELLNKGSKGAGVSLSNGVKTDVKIQESSSPNLEIYMNGLLINSVKLSKYVIQAYLSKKFKSYSIVINHQVQTPIGFGFGSSGACALSLSIAMNKALNIGLSKIKVAQIAHIAEIECKTGLGTVLAETYGGFEIRVKAGAPGIGKIEQINIPNNLNVICLYYGSIDKSKILNDKNLCKLINESSQGLTEKLRNKPSLDNFMKLSRKFADSVNLFSKNLKSIINQIDKEGFTFSMAMIGESIFTIIKNNELEEIVNIVKNYSNSDKNLMICSIDKKGARLL